MRKGWVYKRIKDICDYINRGTTPDYVENSLYKVVNQATFSKGYWDIENIRYSTNNKKEALIRKGDLLIASTGGGVLGKVYYVEEENESYYADSHVTIMRSSDNTTNMKYLYYFFSINYQMINALLAKGATNQTELQRNKLLDFVLKIPPLQEQFLITDYLDKKTSHINSLIVLLEKKRDVYQRLKKGVINNAVTKGLNPHIKLKDSKIDWLGQIPIHWKMKRIKDLANIRNGSDYKKYEEDYGYPVIGSGGQFAYSSKYLYDGEAVLFGRKGTIDRPLYVNCKFWTVDTMFYLICSKDTSTRFFYYMSLIIPFKSYSTATALPSMTQKDINQCILGVSPISEQQEIATYLDEQSEKIDAIVTNINSQIQRLQTLRKSLIREIVTGEKDII